MGRRIAKTKNGQATQRLMYQDFLAPIAELDADGSVVSRFIYATHQNVPDYMVRDGNTYRLITDHLGSVRLVVHAETSDVAQRMDYDEWGNVTYDSSPGFQPFGFAGGLYDVDTGLVRFGFRDYDPEVGRWTAKDPILFAGGQENLYLYCHGDPVNYFDPVGLGEDLKKRFLRVIWDAGVHFVKDVVVDRATDKIFRMLGMRRPPVLGPIETVVGGLNVVGETGPLIKRQFALKALMKDDTPSSGSQTNMTDQLWDWVTVRTDD